MKRLQQILVAHIDPHRQSFFFFHWKISTLLILLTGSVLLTICWRSNLAHTLLDNVFVYLPNYLTHEMAGHNLVGNIFYRTFYYSHRAWGEWIATLAGNGVETLIPLIACWFALRVEGGRWALPPLTYWLATTFYGAGEYAQDARACSMALTSSDMVTNYKPGERCGDWHDILEPLGLLNYDQWVAYTFLFIASLLFMLAVYSAWYYWTHPNFYTGKDTLTPTTHLKEDPLDSWQPPNIYNPQPPQAAGDWDTSRREYPTNVHADRVSHESHEPHANRETPPSPNYEAPGSWHNDKDGDESSKSV